LGFFAKRLIDAPTAMPRMAIEMLLSQ
jgi:hypothetical protein